MTDIVERLRKWCHAVNAASAQDLMDEAADEIERLRNGALEGRETVTLTDEERDRECRRLRSSLQLVADALDQEVWDGRWTNRMMQAHVIARDTLDQVKALPR